MSDMLNGDDISRDLEAAEKESGFIKLKLFHVCQLFEPKDGRV